ncbi:MAG TPA: DUF6127 family protein [Sphingomonadaceae bacterium]
MTTSEDVLAGLIRQATASGGDLATLKSIVEEASDLGAERVLTRLGLADEGAPSDIGELRQLLQAWRDAKSSAWRAAVDWTVRGVLALLLLTIALRLGLPAVFK